MFKFVVVVACLVATAQAGLLHTGGVYAAGGSFAAGPALGAPLLSKVTYNAPETTIVKQQVVVDQPEIRYRAVPTVVQTAPVVQTIQPVVHQAAPVVHAAPVHYSAPHHYQYQSYAAPAITYAAAPAVQTIAHHAPALTYASPAIQTIAAPAPLTYAAGYAAPSWGYSIGAPAFSHGVALLK